MAVKHGKGNILFESEKSGCIDLVIDPTDPNTLYASFWNRIRRRWSDHYLKMAIIFTKQRMAEKHGKNCKWIT
jgi:hypothetical protein